MSGMVGNIESKSGLINRRHAFYARMETDQGVTAGGDYKLALDTVTYDTSNCWDTSNYRLLSPVTGHWQFNMAVRCPDHDYWLIVSWKYNGAYINQGKALHGGRQDSGQGNHLTMSPILWMDAGSYMEVWFHPQVNSTILSELDDGTSTSNSVTWLAGYYLGDYGKGNPA